MKILSDAEDNKDIPSLEIVQKLISEVVAKTVPCDDKVITENYKLGTDVQTALSNLLTYTYVNASGISQLSTSLQNAWNTINALPDYTGGSGIVVSGSVIGHSNNLTAEGTVNTGAIQTPDFGENATLAWFRYDKQGHVTFTGTGGIKIPTADATLSSTSTRPISSKAVYDNLKASVIRATAKTVGSGEATTAIYENVQKTLEGFQSHIYKLHTDITSLGTNVGALNTYKDSINISAGSTTVPVYFNNGVPTVCKYTLGSICTKSTGDYLPITGGTLTGKLTVNSDVVIPNTKAVADNTVPVAGSLATITNKNFTQLKNYKSIIGSVNNTTNSSWYNVISVRHRNGYNDGSNYGMYIYSNLTSSGSLIWNKQTAASTWQGERTIIDSGNYTSYFIVDSELKTGSTNAIQNKVVSTEINSVKSALDATNSVVGQLSTSLQAAFNKFADYLPLSGGTVTGTTTFSHADYVGQLRINRASTASGVISGIDYLVNNTRVGVMGFNADSKLYVRCGTVTNNALVLDNSNAVFSGSVTATSFVGNASTATRLATARKLNGISFDGTVDRNIPIRNCHFYSETTATSKPWHKVASTTLYGANIDRVAVFFIEKSYNGGSTGGILKAHIRTGSSATTLSYVRVRWLVKGTGIDKSNWKLVTYTDSSGVVAELWAYENTNYMGYNVTLLSEFHRVGTTTTAWTLYGGNNGVESPTSGTNSFVSTLMMTELGYNSGALLASGSSNIGKNGTLDITISNLSSYNIVIAYLSCGTSDTGYPTSPLLVALPVKAMSEKGFTINVGPVLGSVTVSAGSPTAIKSLNSIAMYMSGNVLRILGHSNFSCITYEIYSVC